VSGPATDRTLNAAQAGSAVGVSRRTVLAWATDGLEFDEVTGRGGVSKRFNRSEVVAFARSRGRDIRDVPAMPAAPVAEPSPAAGSGDVDFGVLARQARAKFEAFMGADLRQVVKDPAAFQRITTAFQKVSAELRQLEAARVAQLEREGRLIDRGVASRMLASAGSLFVSDLNAVASDLPRRVLVELEAAGVTVSDTASASRVIAEAVRREIDLSRARLSTRIAKDAGIDADALEAES
jgi:hypothetical protein